MTSRNPNARKKTLGSGENPRVSGLGHSNLNASEIISSWAMSGQQSHDAAATHDPAVRFNEVNPAQTTDEAAVAVCRDKQGFAKFLGLSVRSLDRANAMGLLPAPDLVVGRSPRWSPQTIERWLKTRPRLPGRGGRHGQ